MSEHTPVSLTRRRPWWLAASLGAFFVVLVSLSLAACGGKGSQASQTGQAQKGGVVKMALQPGLSPNYIFPLYSTTYAEYHNQNFFEWLMWRPLFWFGKDGQPVFNEGKSLAEEPTVSGDGKTLTVTLKPYKWSDGRPITNRDVEFWFNLVQANKDNWANYVPKQFPDNVVATSFPKDSPSSFSITFDRKYNFQWLFSNEIAQLWAIPQHSWDRLSPSGPIGDYDRTKEGAVKVYKFLDGQARKLSTYATNPLWKVVNGPWRLASYSSTGDCVFVPNPAYSGPDKPKIDKFEQVPFTSTSSELNALLAKEVDYGYIPLNTLGARSRLQANGYGVYEWPYYGVNYGVYNYEDKLAGPMFRQQYMREVLARLVDQDTFVKTIYGGFAVPTYSPVPLSAGPSYLSDLAKVNPYPYDPKRAGEILRAHGWAMNGSGPAVCERPGSGSTEAGAGIPAGTKLELSLQYASGYPEVSQEVQALKSAASEIGMVIHLRAVPNTQLYAIKHGAAPWQIIYYYPGGWYWGIPLSMPTGDLPFGAEPLSCPGWKDPAMGRAANLPMTEGDQGLKTYQDVVRGLAPVLWMPTPPTQISVVSNHLKGWQPQDPTINISPEDWYLTQ